MGVAAAGARGRRDFSEAQRRQYEREGYVFMPEWLAGSEVDELVAALPAAFADEGPWRVNEKDGRAVRSVYGSHRRHPAFDRLVRHPKLLGAARQLLDDEVYVYQFKINAKAAMVGDVWEWHQDYIYWLKEDGMPAPRVVNVVVYLDEVNEFNGPLFLIPGSHREGVLDVPAGGTLPPAYAESPEWISNLTASLKYSVGRDVVGQLVGRHGIVAPKGPRGSALLFHPDLVHASSPNLSPYDRPLVIISYNSVGNAPDPAGLHRPDFLICRDTQPLKPYAAGPAPQPAGGDPRGAAGGSHDLSGGR